MLSRIQAAEMSIIPQKAESNALIPGNQNLFKQKKAVLSGQPFYN